MSSRRPTCEEVERLNEEAFQLISGEDPQKLLALSESARDKARQISYKRGEAYGLVYFLSDVREGSIARSSC